MTNEDKEVGYLSQSSGRMCDHPHQALEVLSAVFCRLLISCYQVFSAFYGLIFWLQDHPNE